MSGCPRCDAAMVDGLPLCLGCGQGTGTARRSPRWIEILEIDGREQGRLLGALRALGAGPSSLLEQIVEQGSFELQVLTSDIEQARLESMLAALGARFRVANTAREEGHEVRWSVGVSLGAKILFSSGAVAASLLLDVPLVAPAGVLVVVLLLLRAFHVVPRALSCPPDAAGRWLGGVSGEFLSQLSAALPALRERPGIERIRPTLAQFVALTAMLRVDGALLLRPELARLDQNLHDLIQQLIRTMVLAGGGVEGERSSMFLSTVEQKLIVFSGQMSAFGALRLKGAPAPLSLLAELQEGIERLSKMARDTQLPVAGPSPP